MNIESIRIDSIDVGNRLRVTDPAHVLFIASSASSTGIRSPIEVRPAKKKGRFELVAGAHRLQAATDLGFEEIPAIVEALSDDQARMREIDENVYRHELSDLDRAVFLAEKKAIHERLYPQTKHGGDRKSDAARDQAAMFGDLVGRFTEEVLEHLDMSERTLQRVIKRASISEDVRKLIAGTPFARNGSELDALVKLEPALQRSAVNMVMSGAHDAPKSFAAASALLAGKRIAVRSDEDIQFAALMKAWKASGARARRRFVDELIADADPIILAVADVDAREAA